MKLISELESLRNKYVVKKEKLCSKKQFTTHDSTRLEVVDEIIDDLDEFVGKIYSNLTLIKLK